MSKISRYSGNLAAFGSNATLNKRTVFNDENTHSDTLTDNINASFYTGWEVLDPNPIPPIQYMTGAMFATTQLAAYSHQVGVPEYDVAQEYHTGGIANGSGQLYRSLTDDNIGNALTDKTHWHLITGDTGDKPYAVFTDFGAVGDGVTDCTAALNAVIADTSLPVLVIPEGVFSFDSPPDTIDRPLTIFGENADLSILLQSYIPTGLSNGLLLTANHSGDVNMGNFTVQVANNMTSPKTINVVSLPSDATSDFNISRVKVHRLGAGSIGTCLSVDGSAHGTPIDGVRIKDCEFHSQTDSALKLEKVKDVEVSGNFNSDSGQDIELAGSAATDNTYINITCTSLPKLTVKQCTDVSVRVPLISTITTDATANKVLVLGDVTTLTGAWINSSIIRPDSFSGTGGADHWYELPNGNIYQVFTVTLRAPAASGLYDLPIPFPNANFGAISATNINDTGNHPVLNNASDTLSQIFLEGSDTLNVQIRVFVYGN